MNLAIILLVAIAIASVIGTILKQNQPAADYIIKFGPFWHDIYQHLGLYDVYASGWFILILAFLVVSTTICIYRKAPELVVRLNRFRLDISEKKISCMPFNTHHVAANSTPESLLGSVQTLMQNQGYKVRYKQEAELITLAAIKGRLNRFGYLFTHLAIIVICIGGLIDGNLPLKIKSLEKKITVETRDIPVNQIPPASRLAASNPSFRSSVLIPEGSKVNYAFINLTAGYLLQLLPFSIQVDDFRIEHYDSGQPKSFASDLTLFDPVTHKQSKHTITVNHPLSYNGYTIYQSSFGDGGSKLQLILHPLIADSGTTQKLKATVGDHHQIGAADHPLQLEIDAFRKFNIFPATGEHPDKKFTDYGPSFTFKLREKNGSAREFRNYMSPIELDKRYFFLSGVRNSANEEFHYLYIPADPDFSLQRFFNFLSALGNAETVNNVINQIAVDSQNKPAGSLIDPRTGEVLHSVVDLFRRGGFASISDFIKSKVPASEQKKAGDAYFKLLQNLLYRIYLTLFPGQGPDTLTADDRAFFDDAVITMDAAHHYGSPFYLELADFREKQASGLQITRTPGKKLVYLGFAMLLIGVYLMFYLHHNRIWITLCQSDDGTIIRLGGLAGRHQALFNTEFWSLDAKFRELLTGTMHSKPK